MVATPETPSAVGSRDTTRERFCPSCERPVARPQPPAPIRSDRFSHHREMPDVAAATRWYMEPIDYLTMRFTGVASATHASRLAMWMTDNRQLNDYRYDAQLLSLVGLDEKFLPPLQPFGSIVGTLSDAVASIWDFRETSWS